MVHLQYTIIAFIALGTDSLTPNADVEKWFIFYEVDVFVFM